MTNTGQPYKAASSSTTVKVAAKAKIEALKIAPEVDAAAVLLAKALEHSKEVAKVVDGSLGARKAVPIRNSFVRNDNPDEDAPLKTLVTGGGGRGAAVPVMLYVALIWKCAKKPFDVKLPARKWAELLGLPDSSGKGARRVANALQTLAELSLIKLEKVHGEASRVTLLDESGDGSEYDLPSTAYSRGGLKRDLYFKVSGKLWTSGKFQQLSAPGLAMLLILLQEGGHKPSNDPLVNISQVLPQGKEVWFTTENFPRRYGISASMRSRGTKELEAAKLLRTKRRPVGPAGTLVSFTTEKVRKIYVLQGDAVVIKETEPKRTKTVPKKTNPKASPSSSAESKKRLHKVTKK